MSEEKNKTELEFMIDKQAKQKYEENLLNLAVAFKKMVLVRLDVN